jgi:DNA-binding transcriptional ArsR family regulator
MDCESRTGSPASRIAAAIADPPRIRMLYSLMDGRARTGIELAAVAGVGPSTASAHLNKLKAARLVKVLVQKGTPTIASKGPMWQAFSMP